jgi:endonuclease/exonuclease/phosphatase family metal-dependent hydrolase
MGVSSPSAGGVLGGVFVLLLMAVCLAVTGVADRPAAAVPRDAATFRVVTFNIHKGADRQGRYDLSRTIAAIANLDADLVGMQEVLRNDPGFNCDDQPALIVQGLRRLTGRPWAHVFARAWITENHECARRGRGDGVATEGLAWFAPEPILASRSIRLSEGRIGLAARSARLPGVAVVLTHLSANAAHQPDRVREIAALMPWAETYGAGILAGDLNATPQASELAPLFGRYRDAWADAAERGLARGVESGSTRPGRRVSRIDYILYAADANLTLETVDVIDTSTPDSPVEVSDHRPVVATFRRSPGRVR